MRRALLLGAVIRGGEWRLGARRLPAAPSGIASSIPFGVATKNPKQRAQPPAISLSDTVLVTGCISLTPSVVSLTELN